MTSSCGICNRSDACDVIQEEIVKMIHKRHKQSPRGVYLYLSRSSLSHIRHFLSFFMRMLKKITSKLNSLNDRGQDRKAIIEF